MRLTLTASPAFSRSILTSASLRSVATKSAPSRHAIPDGGTASVHITMGSTYCGSPAAPTTSGQP